MRPNRRAVTCSFEIGGSTVPAQGRDRRRIGARSCPVQSLNILVYPQPAAPVPTLVLGVGRHALRPVALGQPGIKRVKRSITD